MATKPGPEATIRAVPGVIYAPIERRARVAGTGIEVCKIVKTYRSVAESWERLQTAYGWLTADQLRAALTFYSLNSAFVEQSLEGDEQGALEKFWAEHPETRPPRR